jgi:lipoate-protein ligase A
VECGKCAVGDAYLLARERNMQVTTITDYEHLTATLRQMRGDGVAAYVGACCSQFFIKRHQAFREAGMAAVLMDISGANCYELKQEESAYAGQFQAEARLDADLLAKVMQHVPAVPVTGNRSHRAIPLIPINEARKNA